jgi:hypothetical protein
MSCETPSLVYSKDVVSGQFIESQTWKDTSRTKHFKLPSNGILRSDIFTYIFLNSHLIFQFLGYIKPWLYILWWKSTVMVITGNMLSYIFHPNTVCFQFKGTVSRDFRPSFFSLVVKSFLAAYGCEFAEKFANMSNYALCRIARSRQDNFWLGFHTEWHSADS